jgi:hypothetical protein
MIEDIFIDYANCSLSESPNALYDIYELVSQYISIPSEIKSRTKLSIDLLSKFARFDTFAEANACLQEYKSKNKVFWPKYTNLMLESSFSYVFGYKEGYCNFVCPSFGGVEKINALGKKQFEGKNRLKCYQCDQQYVQYILNEIVKGTKFSQIVGFTNFITNGRFLFRSGLTIQKTSNSNLFNEVIKEEIIYDPLNQLLFFGMFLGAVISYILGNFLTKWDSKKKNPLFFRFKKCVHCGNFKIGDRITPRGANTFCSNKCRDLFHREIRKQSKYHTEYMKEYRKL